MQDQFYIKTFGCQMNVADTERMSALLAAQGLTATEIVGDAKVIIINGCTVREKAVHKALSALGELQVLKKEDGTGPIIGVGGCVGQLDREKLFRRAPYLDFVFGTDTIDNLPEIVHRVKNGERHVVFADFDKSMDYSTETKVMGFKAQAFVNIMKGCDKFCTYCIVPYTRGKEKSRTVDEVVDDIARLVATGVREVTLLGQNVNSFGKGNPNIRNRQPMELHNVIGKVGPRAGEENFPQLLRAIDLDPRCAPLKRIRFTSSHPLDFSNELIECYAPAEQGGVGKLASHLHLPVQSGSNRILTKMGRHHQIENYIEQMDRLRSLSPNVGLSTDLIVGFPTETEEDFEQTLRMLDRLQFDNIYAFAYSSRPGTRASKLPDDVPAKTKKDRLNRLLSYQMGISEKRYALQVGKVMEVLVEGEAQSRQDHPNRAKTWTGRTPCFRVVNFVSDIPENPAAQNLPGGSLIGRSLTGRSLTGKTISVKIVGSSRLSLQGSMEIVQNGDLL